MKTEIDLAVDALKKSKNTIAFTGAGVSVESGIPTFRGETGIWNKYDPNILLYQNYITNPERSWGTIKEIFYDFFGKAKPNAAHNALAKMENALKLSCIITQNIDNLHQEAGSVNILEYHGNSHYFVCLSCLKKSKLSEYKLTNQVPKCKYCKTGVLKPDFVFFGEQIPTDVHKKSIEAANSCDVMLVIGTTGEVFPAAEIPSIAKSKGALIIEINPESSLYTHKTTDIFLRQKAGDAMGKIKTILNL